VSISKRVVIMNSQGLHARPASELVEAMKAFSASVTVCVGEKSANSSSIMSLLALGATVGSEATVIADGPDEEDAMNVAIAVLGSED
tara:strand:- start:2 stop:262 length:261 start_codon:yes stop_codon:yes gene_type:complete